MWSFKFLNFLLLIRQIVGESDCQIQYSHNNRRFKIYLNGFHWLTPLDSYNGTKSVIKDGETIQMLCDNGFISDDLVDTSYTFECTDGKFNKTLLYEDLMCRSDFHKNTKTFQVSSFQLGSGILKCEGKGLEVYQVKAMKPGGNLKHLYTVCFDKNVMRTKFVFQPKRYEVPPRSREPRKDVWGFDRYGKNTFEKFKLSEGYVSKIQKLRITKAFPNKYSKNRNYPYTFNRGHLAPYSDFTEADDKKASCEYINIAPQWKEFNGHSWSLIERETRELVGNSPSEWEIYTGTFGSIPTTNGPLFVSPFFDDNGKFVKGFVPVPKLYWKLVYNTVERNKTRAFVGVNNPELKSPNEFTNKYLICRPKLRRSGRYFEGSEFHGFTYECELEEFLKNLAKEEKIVKAMDGGL